MTLRTHLERARETLGRSLSELKRRERFGDSSWQELEEILLLADVGLKTASTLVTNVRQRVAADTDLFDDILHELRFEVRNHLEAVDRSLSFEGEPSVWIVVGVNGVGKTTTVGKLGYWAVANGKRVVLAAGDTYRAAAVQQLSVWADRSGASIVRGAEGSDPGAVIFDAIEHADARDAHLVVADTAGRIHTRKNLMDELSKIQRVAERGNGTIAEILLVMDATTGQNGLIQAQMFREAVGVTGLVLTKLDGSSRGGFVLAVEKEIGLPVKFVGVGEGPSDLAPFVPSEFVEALFGPSSGLSERSS